MRAFRLTLGKVTVAGFVFLWAAALILPNLDSHARVHPAVKVIVTVYLALLLGATPIALVDYFNRQWRRVRSVPNRSAYVLWLSLESIAAMGVLGLLAYALVTAVVSRLR